MFYIQFLNLVFSSNRNYLSFDQDVPNLSPATDNHHPALLVQRFIIHKDDHLFLCVAMLNRHLSDCFEIQPPHPYATA
jgi:hypothetical protein